MGRKKGTNKDYIAAKHTVAQMLTVEKTVADNVVDALNKVVSIMNDNDAPLAVQRSSAALIIEMHKAFAKERDAQTKAQVTDEQVAVDAMVDEIDTNSFIDTTYDGSYDVAMK